LLLAESSFAAEPHTVTLSGTAPGCPGESYLNDRVARLVGADVREAAAHVSVTPSAGRYDVVVSVRRNETSGERRFSADTCALAVDAAALVVAISIFPERALELTQRAESSNPNEASTSPSPPAPREERAERAPPVAPAPSPRLSVGLHASIGAAAFATSLPRPAVGPAGALGVSLGSLAFDVFGAVFDSQTVQSIETQSAELSMQSVGVRGCYATGRGAVAYGGCAAVVTVRLAGSGRGTDRTYDDAAIYWGPALGALFRVRVVNPFWLRLQGDFFVPVARRPFLLDTREIHRPAAADVSTFLGPEISF